ncbi:coiled-coil domain-containing protein 113-like [Hyposmocoma kahamanoa]|uniref:coiled-coil domain-containing protein 113-like n=1 Tax=Hyposmocoma kahamanoa TaxID=1477025 RepID=UPI000E6D7075|nr:coiled-coil domain-containing protein 113-like [Hyposmocoma kahamanoa]
MARSIIRMSHTHSHYRASLSQHSRSISQFVSSDMDELSDDELLKMVNDIKRQIKILSLENEVIEKTILRVDPGLMHGVAQALEYAIKLQSTSSLNVGSFKSGTGSRVLMGSITSPSRLFMSPSKASTIFKRVESSGKVTGTIIFGSGPRVNVMERSELVSNEMEILIQNLEKSRLRAARQHALLKAQLEEISIRMVDVEKATEVFNQQVIIEGWDKIAQRIPAEIWVRYMAEWVKICDSKISKLRLRTSTMNSQYSKLKGQIKIKAELSENLRPVDFEQTKIENYELSLAIDHKLKQLVELKKMTGDANLNLAIHKKALMDQNAYLDKVRKDIKTKERLTIELDSERNKIDEQVCKFNV